MVTATAEIETAKVNKSEEIRKILTVDPNATFGQHKEKLEPLGIGAAFFSNIKSKFGDSAPVVVSIANTPASSPVPDTIEGAIAAMQGESLPTVETEAKINKSDVIREILKSDPNATYSQHKERLEPLEISSGFFSNIKHKMNNESDTPTAEGEATKTRKKRAATAIALPQGSDLTDAIDYVRKMGGVKKAREALEAESEALAQKLQFVEFVESLASLM